MQRSDKNGFALKNVLFYQESAEYEAYLKIQSKSQSKIGKKFKLKRLTCGVTKYSKDNATMKTILFEICASPYRKTTIELPLV